VTKSLSASSSTVEFSTVVLTHDVNEELLPSSAPLPPSPMGWSGSDPEPLEEADGGELLLSLPDGEEEEVLEAVLRPALVWRSCMVLATLLSWSDSRA
jgi:hypothetical protein